MAMVTSIHRSVSLPSASLTKNRCLLVESCLTRDQPISGSNVCASVYLCMTGERRSCHTNKQSRQRQSFASLKGTTLRISAGPACRVRGGCYTMMTSPAGGALGCCKACAIGLPVQDVDWSSQGLTTRTVRTFSLGPSL